MLHQIKQLVALLTLFLWINACHSPTTESANQKSLKLEKKAPKTLLYVGTYTKKEGHVDGQAEGIYILEMNPKTGELAAVDTIKNTVNPSYLTLHPNGKYLYAVNEIAGDGNPPIGTVSAFLLDKNGHFSKTLNTVAAEGDAPCHISVDPTGKYVLVASYMGSIAAFPIQSEGSLGKASSVIKHELENPRGGRQEAAHTHMIQPAIDDESVFVVDLGMDEVVHYQLNDGQLEKVTATNLAAGAGGRHLDFHPTEKWVYVLNELNNTVEFFDYKNAQTPFNRRQTISTLSDDAKAGKVGTSAIHIHPSGKFLYAANRGLEDNAEQSIAMFKIDEVSGELTLLGLQDTKGKIPRDFAIDPGGQFLLVGNQDTNTIVTFRINQQSGRLENTPYQKEVKTPVCLKFFVSK